MGVESGLPEVLSLSAEVRNAADEGTPVVALESAVLTHGLPYPQNLDVCMKMESVVRAAGATPATVGMVGGRVHVGLNTEQLAGLSEASELSKLGVRDLASAAMTRASGGMTVAATMFVALRCGIQVMATGGIGGVHRERSLDVSADLTALGEQRMLVVCAGAKSILDLSSTLEMLESASVPVVGYQTDEFPAFYSRHSGLPVSTRLDSPGEVVEYWRNHIALGMKSAVLVTNPIPEAESIAPESVAAWTATASNDASASGVRGKDLTPFLLRRVAEISRGQSVRANEALLLHNAQLAAHVATALARRPGMTTRRSDETRIHPHV